MDPPRDLLQVLHGAGQARRHLRQLRPELDQLGGHRGLGAAQVEGEGDETLLRAVVEIALDAAAGLVGGGDDPGARGAEFGAAVGVGDGGGDELGELLQAALDPNR